MNEKSNNFLKGIIYSQDISLRSNFSDYPLKCDVTCNFWVKLPQTCKPLSWIYNENLSFFNETLLWVIFYKWQD